MIRSYCTPAGKSAFGQQHLVQRGARPGRRCPRRCALHAVRRRATNSPRARPRIHARIMRPGYPRSADRHGRARWRPGVEQIRGSRRRRRCAGQQVGHQIQLRVATARRRRRRRRPRTRPARARGVGQPVAPDLVVVEQAVPVRAEHRAAADADAEPVVLGAAADEPVVDLVAAQRRGRGARSVLSGANTMSASSRPSPSMSRHADSTGSSMRRHSIWKPPQMPSTGRPAAAWAMTAVGQAALAQPRQVGDGGLAARDHHHVGVGQIGGVGHPPHHHSGLTGQRLDVGGVGDPRQPDRGDPQPPPPARWLRHSRRHGWPAPTPSPRCPATTRRSTAARRRWDGRSAPPAGRARAPAAPGPRGTC